LYLVFLNGIQQSSAPVYHLSAGRGSLGQEALTLPPPCPLTGPFGPGDPAPPFLVPLTSGVNLTVPSGVSLPLVIFSVDAVAIPVASSSPPTHKRLTACLLKSHRCQERCCSYPNRPPEVVLACSASLKPDSPSNLLNGRQRGEPTSHLRLPRWMRCVSPALLLLRFSMDGSRPVCGLKHRHLMQSWHHGLTVSMSALCGHLRK